MRIQNEPRDPEGLSQLVDELEEKLGAMRQSGGLRVQDVQQAVNQLTELQLMLNELYRVSDARRETDREVHEHYSELDGRIRRIRGALYDELRRGGSPLNVGA